MTDERQESALDGIIFIAVFLLCFKLFFVSWITSDGLSYFSYLRSIVADGDLDFRNEFDWVQRWGTGRIHCGGDATQTGLVGNCFSIGPAILWSIAYVPVYLFRYELFSHVSHAGYGIHEVYAVCFSTMVYTLAGLYLLYGLLQRFASKTNAFIATLASWLATPLVYYMYHEPSMSHGLSFFTVTLFIHTWFTRPAKTKTDMALLGACAGLMSLVRWQNALFIVIPVLDNAFDIKAKHKSPGKDYALALATRLMPLALAAAVVFAPQALAWKTIYGSYFTVPQGEGFMDWAHPHLTDFLFSGKHGLFSWTPIHLLGCAGLYMLARKDRKTAIILAVAVLLQIYLNSAVSSWHGDWSFGARRMVGSIPVFAIGLTVLLESVKTRLRIIIVIAVAAAVAWNILLLVQVTVNHTLIDPAVPYRQLAENQLTRAPEMARELFKAKFST
ncbi:MAG: hypothetical protein ABH834_03285 [Candidatus Altiarchaeota archaeon]